MSDVTQLLAAVNQGAPGAWEALLPLVYAELRAIAAQRINNESPGQTLQATALVNEAYLRLVSAAGVPLEWGTRGHFFTAAAEAMRRILIDRARAKGAVKRGRNPRRLSLGPVAIADDELAGELLDLDAALSKLADKDPTKAQLVKLRFFAGLTLDEAAATLGMSPASADRDWSYARAWLYNELVRE